VQPQLNPLDRAIGWLAPRWGNRRAFARARMQAIQQASEIMAGHYDGARTGRRMDNWITQSTDANASIGGDLVRLRDRSRDLIRNNPHARRAASIAVTAAVGTGILPHADTGDPARNDLIDKVFEEFSRECDAEGQLDFFGLQALAVRSVFESGEVLVRRRVRLTKDGLTIPLQYQLLESDMLDLSATTNKSGGQTIQGVERNAFGQRAGYWLFPVHPGATSASIYSFRQGTQSRFVPASEILHTYRKERPGQERGVPGICAALTLLREVDEYMEAEIVRAKIQACMSAFVTQVEDPDTGRTIAPTSTEPSTGKRIETFRPGMVQYLKPGEDVKFAVPTGHGNAVEYLRFLEHIAAIAMDMLYVQMTGDLTAVNYSSYRAGDRDFRGTVEAFRWLCVIPMLLQPLWDWFIDMAHLAGRIPVQAYGVNWDPPQFMSVDPVKDAAGDEMEMANGNLTWAQSVARRGYDPAKQLAQIVEWKKKFDEAGVVFAWDRSKVNASGTVQKAAAEAVTSQD